MSLPSRPSSLRRSQSQSPKQRTPQSSPKRRPLHERSESETNASNSPVLDPPRSPWDDYEKPVKIDPFPRLPSQILRPQRSRGEQTFIYEDEPESGPSVSSKGRNSAPPTLPRPSSPKRGRSKSPSPAARKSPKIMPATNVPRLSSPPVLKPSISVSSTFSSLRSPAPSVRRLKERYEELGSTSVQDERPSRRQLYSPVLQETHVVPLPEILSPISPLSPALESTRRSSVVSPVSLRDESVVEDEPGDETVLVTREREDADSFAGSDQLQISALDELLDEPVDRKETLYSPPIEAQLKLAKVLQDAHRSRTQRSPSVDSIRTPLKVFQDAEKSRIRRSPSVDSIQTPPRPLTIVKEVDSPTSDRAVDQVDDQIDDQADQSQIPNAAAATDAMIQALIDSGENVQYPKLRKPSATSLRTEASSIRRAYPPPLRLRRKRAYSDISAEISNIEPAPYSPYSSTSTTTDLRPRLQPRTSYTTLGSHTSIGSIPVHAPAPLRVTSVTYHNEAWHDEVEDTLTELQAPALRRQRSSYFASVSEISRPASANSVYSSRFTFYHFLNDSHTAWARDYYRGEGRLQTVTPPFVTEVSPPRTPISDLVHRASLSSLTHKASISSLKRQASFSDMSRSPASAGFPESLYVPRLRPLQQDIDTISVVSHGTSLIVQPARFSFINEEMIEEEPYQSAEHIAEMPHLAPPKRKSEQHEPGWTAPSLDEFHGVFSRVNRQIALFCLGFIFPFAWMSASFLALPACPNWRSNTPNFDHAHEYGDASRIEQDITTAELYESFELRRYKKARWWRTANRYMSLVGICIVIVIIIASTVTATT